MTSSYSANRKPTRFNLWRVFWLLRDMFSLGFSDHPYGSPRLFIKIVVILLVSFTAVLSEDLKPKRKSGDAHISITQDKKKIKSYIEQFDDPETVEKFLRDLLNPDLMFPQIPKDKEDVNVESESQDDPLDSNTKDENQELTDKSEHDSTADNVPASQSIPSINDEKTVKSIHSPSDKHEDSEPSVAQRLYDEAMSILETESHKTSADKTALELLSEASRQGHTKAREQVAMLTLLGGYTADPFQSAYSAFEELSNEGNPRGQFGLGFLYASGLHVNASIPHALIYLTFSSLGGDNFADMALGYRYWTGVGVEEDCEAALTHYHRVAQVVYKEVSERSESGGPTLLGPMVRRARLLDEIDAMGNLDGGDLTISEDLFQYYQFMAYKKNVSAMVGLGQLYYYGRHGVEMNHEKAFYYFNLAAESGSAIAMAYLGEMYMVGSTAVPADSTKALKYLRKSAEENNPIGQTGLALAYLYGRAGLPVKPVIAMELFLKAADQGWPEAQLHLGRLFLGTHGIKTDYKSALKYFTMASQQGNVIAFYHLAEMHAKGTGVLRSCSTAAELFKNVAERGRWSKMFMSAYSAFRNRRYHEAFVTYQLLAELGYEVAQSNVAFILEEVEKATGIPKDEIHKRAFTQWQRSATQGSTSSRVKLGDYYYYGLGTDVSYQKAIQHYRIASDLHHNAQAMFNLGYMHEQGLGLKRDLYLAKRFYDMAAEASIDARVAVYLALIRLSFYFVMDFFNESSFFQYIGSMFSSRSYADEHEVDSVTDSTTTPTTSSYPSGHLISTMDWDFYAIPFLTGLLLLFLFYIRHRRV
ncbi:unnamed protein product [Schistosoma rodhaini]|uniref:DOD-type homing endonuclease domain-containing protein n=1 Tax=Schistosoma rodhaini TaxID=6188 RepID=A0AA85F9S3_9TREM|nr:unnamed protein product [Schistosoma rodhaini]